VAMNEIVGCLGRNHGAWVGRRWPEADGLPSVYHTSW